MSFTKLFSTITDSSIWSEDDHTRLVWITMLAMADQFGRVLAAVPGLAHRARVPIPSVEKALKKFLAPDPYSRTKEHEGRRIEETEGGWRLLNHEFYREIRNAEDRKEQIRQAQARRREKLRVIKASSTVIKSHHSQPPSAHAEAEAEADTKEKKAFSLKTKIPENLNSEAFREVWAQWVAHRMTLKKPRDWETFFANQLRDLSDWGEVPAIESLKISVRNGYQGLFEQKKNGFQPQSKPKPFQP